MNDLQTVGVREFRENLAHYMRGKQPVEVTSYGRAVGYFIPAMSQNCVIVCTQQTEKGTLPST